MSIFFNKINIFLVLAFFCFFIGTKEALAVYEKNVYPKLANYFLKWTIADHEVNELAKWDLLVLDMEVQINSKNNLKKIREINPDIIILAYITSQEANANIHSSQWSHNATLRKKLADNIIDSWWLKNKDKSRTTFWEGTYLLNITDGAGANSRGQRWNDYLPEFVNREIISTGLWDGVFYDNVWGDVAWVRGDFDANNDGRGDTISEVNNAWSNGVKKMLKKTRELIGSKYLILGNGKVYDGYQGLLNGVMLEGFPSSWESNGNWDGILKTYSNISEKNNSPKITIINSYSSRQSYQKMRFGLASVMMESHGYFSFDYDVSSHGQVWWYDEYDVSLGKAQSSAYDLLNKGNTIYKKSLWRRDFENGVVILNSSDKEQLYVFKQEEFQKINGIQDRTINNGSIINFIKIKPNDAVILLKRISSVATIKNNSFNNGDFIRVFDSKGQQNRSGFFAYVDSQPANSQILISDIDNDGRDETLVNSNGLISIYKNGQKVREFKPYDGKFTGDISFAVADLDGDKTKEIITGAGQGGGPHVRVFNKDGKPLIGGFFAYDKNFRGGVRVAVMDLDGDKVQEIITAAGQGGGPHIRIFNKDGKPLIGGFFAYDKNFRGGVSLAVGDIDGDGKKEILTAPGAGRSPEVKIFNKDGKNLNSFMAYENDFRSGLRIMSDDLDGDKNFEILVGTTSF
ncbi:MAG: putative glycoside hydrolase [Patescibacteria group bacterium]|nr:putative glycoside hydrolase [Patescibacteria group bacterium]